MEDDDWIFIETKNTYSISSFKVILILMLIMIALLKMKYIIDIVWYSFYKVKLMYCFYSLAYGYYDVYNYYQNIAQKIYSIMNWIKNTI